MLSYSDKDNSTINDLSFKLEEFKLPLILKTKDIHHY